MNVLSAWRHLALAIGVASLSYFFSSTAALRPKRAMRYLPGERNRGAELGLSVAARTRMIRTPVHAWLSTCARRRLSRWMIREWSRAATAARARTCAAATARSTRITKCRRGAMAAAASMPSGNGSTTRGRNRISAADSTTKGPGSSLWGFTPGHGGFPGFGFPGWGVAPGFGFPGWHGGFPQQGGWPHGGNGPHHGGGHHGDQNGGDEIDVDRLSRATLTGKLSPQRGAICAPNHNF